MDFAGQTMAAKIFSREIQVHNRCKVGLEALPRKFHPQNEQNLAKPRNILSSKMLDSFAVRRGHSCILVVV